MLDAIGSQPAFVEAVHALPRQAGALAAAPKRPMPVPDRLGVKRCNRIDVAGHGVVVAVPAHHARQPLPLDGDRVVPALHQLGLHRA